MEKNRVYGHENAVEIGNILDAFFSLPPKEKFGKGMDIFVLGSGKGKVSSGSYKFSRLKVPPNLSTICVNCM